ncbi:MAG: aminopeptidase P family protein [Limnochordaceae bacterium]|nr:aminopeptidase P family protein [Limnochordaceae bacterium]
MYDAIPLDEIRARQEAIRASLGQRGLDAILVVGRSFYDRVGDLAYVSNHFPPFPATVFAGGQRGLGHALLLIPASGPSALLLDGWAYRREMVAADEVEASPDLPALLVAVLKRRGLGGARVGLVGEDILPLAMARALGDALPALELRRADEVVRAMRRIKSPAEQSLLRRAADIAGAGLDAAVGALRGAGAGQAEQLTERAVCAEGIARAMREGADFVRYLRVHAGSWSAVGSRWPQATERPIAPGEVVTLDIIGAYQGYQFDVLRTTVAGPPDVRPAPAHRRLLEAVLEAARRAVGSVPARHAVQGRGAGRQRLPGGAGVRPVRPHVHGPRHRARDGGGAVLDSGRSDAARAGHGALRRAGRLRAGWAGGARRTARSGGGVDRRGGARDRRRARGSHPLPGAALGVSATPDGWAGPHEACSGSAKLVE